MCIRTPKNIYFSIFLPYNGSLTSVASLVRSTLLKFLDIYLFFPINKH